MEVTESTPNNIELCGRPTPNGPCQNRCGKGTPHLGYGPCKFHGGALPNVVKHWQTQMAMDECTKMGVPVEVEPNEALLAALYEAEGHAMWLREMVEHHGEQAIVTMTQFGPLEGYWHQLWSRERDRAARLAEACVRAGIAERQVKLAEQQAEILVSVIRRVLDDPELRLNAEQQQASGQIVARHLRAVS